MKYVLLTYKKDARYKTGERLYNKVVMEDTEERMQELVDLPFPGWRAEYHPEKKIVTNLMSGTEVEIAWDTPHCCDPSTETYWSL